MENKQIELIEKFWDFNEHHHLSSSAILIYLFLLRQVFNKNNLQFSISDVYLSKQLGLTRKTIKSNKKILQKHGLVKLYIRNGVASSYELITGYQLQISNAEKIFKEENSFPLTLTHGKAKSKNRIKTNAVVKSKALNNFVKNDHQVKNTGHKFKNPEVPTLHNFLKFAQGLEHYQPNLEHKIKGKYLEWSKNEWKNNFDRPIINWKSVLKNTLPYLKNDSDAQKGSFQNIPDIKRINLDE